MAASWVSMQTPLRSPASRPDWARVYGDRLVLRQANFRELAEVAPAAGFGAVDGALFDLGLSSFQLADRERGFGFRTGGPLDMRFDTSRGVPAAELLASLDTAELTALFRRYGEEPKAPRIARAIVDARRSRRSPRPRSSPRSSNASLPPNPRQPRRTHPATRVFQALAHRRQRGARRAPGRPRRGARPAPTGRPARRPELPLARGPHRQALLPGRAARLHLPARAAGLRLRPEPPPATRDQSVAHPDRRRDRRQSTSSECPTAGRRASRRLAPAPEGGAHDEQASPRPTVARPTGAASTRCASGRTAATTPKASSSSSASGARPARPTRSASSIRAVRASASRSATERWPSTRAHVLAPRAARAVAAASRAQAPTLRSPARPRSRSVPAAGRTVSASSSAHRRRLHAGVLLARPAGPVSATGLTSAGSSLERAAPRRRCRRRPFRPQPARPRAGHPQARHRRRPRAAGRTARPAGPLSDRPTDAWPDRFPPPPAVPAPRLRHRVDRADARWRTGRSSIATGWRPGRRPDDDHRRHASKRGDISTGIRPRATGCSRRAGRRSRRITAVNSGIDRPKIRSSSEVTMIRASSQALAGELAHVPAEPALTAPWPLELSLGLEHQRDPGERLAAARDRDPGCHPAGGQSRRPCGSAARTRRSGRTPSAGPSPARS